MKILKYFKNIRKEQENIIEEMKLKLRKQEEDFILYCIIKNKEIIKKIINE